MRWRLTPSRARPGWLTLIGPWDEAFKADLMARIPQDLREYCPPPLRVWRMHESQQRLVQSLIVLHSDPEELAPVTVEELLALASELSPTKEPADLRDALELTDGIGEIEQLLVRAADGRTVVLAVLFPSINGEEREALEAIVDIMSLGCDGMHVDGPLTEGLAKTLVDRGIIAGAMMPTHPDYTTIDDTDELGDPAERMGYWITQAGGLALRSPT